MGQKPEEIVKDIEVTRDALGQKVDLLAGQVRVGVDSAKQQGVRVVTVAGGVLLGILIVRRLFRR